MAHRIDTYQQILQSLNEIETQAHWNTSGNLNLYSSCASKIRQRTSSTEIALF